MTWWWFQPRDSVADVCKRLSDRVSLVGAVNTLNLDQGIGEVVESALTTRLACAQLAIPRARRARCRPRWSDITGGQ